MKKEIINEKEYKLPNSLTKFQKELYVHLIDYKRKHITKQPGDYKYKGSIIKYDAILPISVHSDYPLIYSTILKDLKAHLSSFPFKLHIHFNHMASSQAANVNLFLPILLSPKANDILRLMKSDFKELAIDELYKGFRIDWDGTKNYEKGLLGDHNARSGTDSDIAIAYYNHDNELCLWLIEHKLTEKEFTECGGFKSNGRDKTKHLCNKPFADILNNNNLCYYTDVRKNNYWKITIENKYFFVNHASISDCPFKKGMNQLWRNQIMGLAIEKVGTFKHIYFSVVHHPDNHALDKSMDEYKKLIDYNPKFTSFTSKDVIRNAKKVTNKDISAWVDWYCELYKI